MISLTCSHFRCSKKRGYGLDCDGRLLTVFSSSNYCGTECNVTGYVQIGTDMTIVPHELRQLAESGAYREFNIFEIKLDENTKQVEIVM